MKTLNLEKFGTRKPSFFLALEEYLLKNSSDEIFFLWDTCEGIVIGKNQLLLSEVNLEYTKENNIPIYRRPSGGGAIYTDNNSFMFTFITRRENKDEIFKVYLQKIIMMLNKVNLNVYFSGRNDLLFDRKKFSGNSFYKTANGCVLHGTFLFDTDLEKLVKCLNPNDEKLISKGIKSVKERVVNLKEFLPYDKYQLMKYLQENISQEKFDNNIDLKKVLEIEEKYLNHKWIYDTNPPYTFHNKKRFSFGSIEVFIEINKGKINDFFLKGDFFEINNLNLFYEKLKETIFSLEEVNKVLKKNDINNYILDMNNEELQELIFGKDK